MRKATLSQFWNKKTLDSRRATFAREIVDQSARGKSVLDLGCGSGYFFRGLEASHFAKLHGVDFSDSAIAMARSQSWADNVSFNLGEAAEVDVRKYDFVVALGLLDWLSDDQVSLLLNRLSGRRFVISFLNSSAWSWALLHAAFVGYRPRYFHAQELLSHFDENTVKDIRFTTLPEHPLVGFW